MTPDEAIAIVKSKARGRTKFEGQEPFIDEVLVAEVERLRESLASLATVKWKSVDRDNMEFEGTITTDQMDDILAAALAAAREGKPAAT